MAVPKPKLSDLIAASAQKQRPAPPPRLAGVGVAQAIPPLPAVAAPAPAVALVAPPPPPPNAHRMAAALRARRFVAEFIRNGFNGGKAYLAVLGGRKGNTAYTGAYALLQTEIVRQELEQQLRAIEVVAELDIEYLFRQMRSIAETSIFDIVEVKDGRPQFESFNSADLTREQRLNVREIAFHPNGRVRSIKLASREKAIDMLNQAKGLYEGSAGAQTQVNIAQKLRERMTAAAKRVPGVTIDNKTGEVVGGN